MVLVRRRQILAAAAALVAMPRPLIAQTRKIYRIGWPSAVTREAAASFLAAFEQGLRERGYSVGQDIVIDFRHAGPNPESIAATARELVRGKADVLVTGANASTIAVKSVTRDVPIVFAIGIDVIGQGFAKTFARPGGNLTGLTWNVGDLAFNKRMELLKEAAPKISRVAVLYDSTYDIPFRGPLQSTAKALGLKLFWLELTSDFERSFAAVVRGHAEAIYTVSGAQQFARRSELASLAARNRLPATIGISEFVDAGGLMSYGPNVPDLFRRAATYVDKILKGAKPGDLPVEQPTRIDLDINLKTARQIGLTIPQSLLLRANRVIE